MSAFPISSQPFKACSYITRCLGLIFKRAASVTVSHRLYHFLALCSLFSFLDRNSLMAVSDCLTGLLCCLAAYNSYRSHQHRTPCQPSWRATCSSEHFKEGIWNAAVILLHMNTLMNTYRGFYERTCWTILWDCGKMIDLDNCLPNLYATEDMPRSWRTCC